MYDYEDFLSERLAQLRIQHGVSARDMSLSIGQSANYINMIENKRSMPSMTVFFYICEYLGVTPQEFFDTGSGNPTFLREVIADLKKLDNRTLTQISEVIKSLSGR